VFVGVSVTPLQEEKLSRCSEQMTHDVNINELFTEPVGASEGNNINVTPTDEK